jgi:hypothetical protein
MGYDYYITKYLYIKYKNDKSTSYIELGREGAYFYEPNIDEDDENYEKIIDENIKEQLKSNMKPIIIYDNNKFNTINLENKYKKLIEDELKNKEKNYEHILKITKNEMRYERE